MFDLSWSEILVIAVVAIVFIGPKELPAALRALGKWTAKARTMAREFQNNVDEMVRESELDEIRKQVQNIESGALEREIERTVDPKGELSAALAPPEALTAPLPTPPPAPGTAIESPPSVVPAEPTSGSARPAAG